VLQREPDNETALRGLLETRLEMGDIPGAITPLEKLAEIKPEQPEYMILLAQAKQQVNDREGAAQAYRSILANQPGNLGALQGLVGLLLEEDRPEAAIGLLQDTMQMADQANEIQPDSIDTAAVQLILGQVYAEQQRYEEAIAVYDELTVLDDQDFRPLVAKAIVLRAQGNVEEAQPLFELAASLAPSQYKDQINQLAQEAATAGGNGDTGSASSDGVTDAPATPDDLPTDLPTDVESPAAGENSAAE
jgi:tetratricopeptide (TPR) repeat protein